MEEKIKIYVPQEINNILLKDMELFEMFKKDGSLNKNEFYNTLIVNYYEQFQENQSQLFNYINKTIINETDATDFEANDIASNILQYIDNNSYRLSNKKLEVTLSIKPTKKSIDTIDFIQNYYIVNTTLSSYFRNMFASYALLSQDKRERIIFKKEFELIEEAIKLDRKLYFLTKKSDSPHIASPYSISTSKEELFNYMLAEYNSLPYSFRISRMHNVVVLNEPRELSKEFLPLFDKMDKYGPQFAYKTDEIDNEIIIKLTERGQRMYKTFYLHRPKCSKIEDDNYYFNCSIAQASIYFSRFGRHALVISPKSLANELFNFHSSALKAYRRFNKENNN